MKPSGSPSSPRFIARGKTSKISCLEVSIPYKLQNAPQDANAALWTLTRWHSTLWFLWTRDHQTAASPACTQVGIRPGSLLVTSGERSSIWALANKRALSGKALPSVLCVENTACKNHRREKNTSQINRKQTDFPSCEAIANWHASSAHGS